MTVNKESTSPGDGHASLPVGPEGSEPRSTRRAFLGGAGKKALYLTPVVLTLTARQAAAASGYPCGSNYVNTVGSPCATDGSLRDCCPAGPNPLTCDEMTMTCQPT